MKKGEVKQYIIPDDLNFNASSASISLEKDEEQNSLGFQIGFSIEEKAYMEIADPNVPKSISMIFNFRQNNSVNNKIEIGKTYIYEPGDTVNLQSIQFDKNQWYDQNKNEFKTNYKGYLDIIVTSQNNKKEEDYLDQQEEF